MSIEPNAPPVIAGIRVDAMPEGRAHLALHFYHQMFLIRAMEQKHRPPQAP